MNTTGLMGPFVVSPSAVKHPQLRILCFPGAGAGVSAFRDWWNWPDRSVEVCCLQLPGRESRIYERPICTISELVTAITRNLKPWLGQPYIFLGHSLGALISFEVARALRQAGELGPRHLFVAASAAPHLPWPHSPVHKLSSHELLTAVNRRYQSIPRQVFEDPELQQLVLPSLRADFTMVETYCHRDEPPLNCPISVFGGARDKTLQIATLEAWQQHTSQRFRLEMLAGDHFLLGAVRRRMLQLLPDELRECSFASSV